MTFERLVNDAIGLNLQSRLRNADAEATYEPKLFRKYGFSLDQIYIKTAKDYKQLYVLLGE